jgi:hypothetical protein
MVNRLLLIMSCLVLPIPFSVAYISHSGNDIRGGDLAIDGLDVTGTINSSGLSSNTGNLDLLRITGSRTYLQGYAGGNHWFSTGGLEPNSLFVSFISADGIVADAVRIAPRNATGLFVNSFGYVGINTLSPTQVLSVNGEINVSGAGHGIYYPDGTFQTSASGGASGDNLGNHNATENIRLNGYWLSTFGGNEGLTINAAGNVGIGTPPIQKLDVRGNITTNGAISLGGVRRASWSARYCTPTISTGEPYTGLSSPISLINPASGANICEDDTGCAIYMYIYSDSIPGFQGLLDGGPLIFVQGASAYHGWYVPDGEWGNNGDGGYQDILRCENFLHSWHTQSCTLWDDWPGIEDGPDEIILNDGASQVGFKITVCDY